MFYIHIIYFFTEQQLKKTTPRPENGPWLIKNDAGHHQHWDSKDPVDSSQILLFDTFEKAKEFLTKKWNFSQAKHNFKISDSWGWEPKERLFEWSGHESYGELNYAYRKNRTELYWIRPFKPDGSSPRAINSILNYSTTLT
jgi:hypothetical protein